MQTVVKATTFLCSIRIRVDMPAPSSYRVLCAELLREGVAITFSDGKAALYSADFLYASLSQAQELTLDEDEDPDH